MARRAWTIAAGAVIAAMPVGAHAQTTLGPSAPERGRNSADPATGGVPSSGPASPPATQQPSPAEDAGEEVLVTGTRIRRPNAVSAAPITTVDAQELRYQGALNVEEALNRLPQVTSDLTQFSNAPDANGQAHVNLRNLGWERTLVLVDGQRLGPAEGIDLNQIPSALVQRIDVLTGGASATYGSDAVAGVVNFILDKKFEGLSLNLNYGFYQHTNDNDLVRGALAQVPQIPVPNRHVLDGQRVDVNAAYGIGFAGGDGHLSVFGGYRDQQPVVWGDRDFSACRITLTGSDVACATNSFYTDYGTFIPRGGPNNGSTYHLPINGGTAFATGDGPYAYNTRSNWNFIRADRRITAGAFLDYSFGKALSIYANGMLLDDKSRSQFVEALVDGTATIGCNNPYLSAAQATTLCGAAAGTAQQIQVDLGYRLLGAGRPPTQNVARNKSYRVTAGIRGGTDDGTWHYDVNYVDARVNNAQSDSYEVAPQLFLRAVDVVPVNGVPTCRSRVDGTDPACVPANIFSYRSLSDAFFGYAGRDYFFYRTTKLRDVNLNVTGDLGRYGLRSPWATDGVAIAIGAEYRYNSLRNRASQDAIDFIGFPNNNRGSFDAKEVYGELQLPLVADKPFFNRLELGGAYRLSKYQNQSKALDTYKIELQYRPVADFLLRGSYNRAARAPNVTQLYTPANRNATFGGIDGGGDACAGPNPTASFEQCARTGVTRAQYGAIPQCPNNECRVVSFDGNTALKPENARTFTVGGVFTPSFLRPLTLSVDYYDIRIKGYLGYVSAGDYYSRCLTTGLAYYCDSVRRNPGNGALFGVLDTGGYVAGGWQNTDTLATRGLDVQANYRTPRAGWGSLEFDFVGTYLFENGGRNSPAEEAYNTVGYFGPPSAYQVQPRWRNNLRTTWQTPWLDSTISLNWRHLSGVDLAANSDDPTINRGATPFQRFGRIPAYDFIDLAGSIQLGPPVTLRLSMNNLLDRTPPVVLSTFVDGTTNNPNTYTGTYDPLGRQVLLTLSVRLK